MESNQTKVLMTMKKENEKYLPQPTTPSIVYAAQNRYPVLSQNELLMLQKYPTYKDFCNVFNEKCENLICQYPTACILGASPTLIQIDMMYGSLTSTEWLINMVADVSLNCGLKNDASEDQLLQTATAISTRYKWLKVGELILFFFNFKAGYYERFYSRFDPQVIIRSIKTFLEERASVIDEHVKAKNMEQYQRTGDIVRDYQFTTKFYPYKQK